MDKSAKQTNGVKFRLQALQRSYKCKMDDSAKQKNGVKQLCNAATNIKWIKAQNKRME